jgi:Disulphide bond corrector protein DsbC
VQWAGAVNPKATVERGKKLALELSAVIEDGWHVYGLEQLPTGPAPLRATLGENDVALSAGSVSDSEPIKKHDRGFDLDTQEYSHSILLHLPIQLKSNSPARKQMVPVNNRFQACSDKTCLPPRTVLLSVPIEIFER